MREAFLTDAARRFNDEFQFCAGKWRAFAVTLDQEIYMLGASPSQTC